MSEKQAVNGGNGIRDDHADWTYAANTIVASPVGVAESFISINQWGIDRGMVRANGATALAQIVKLRKEINELEKALIEGNDDEIVDGIGDSLVVLVQVARLAQVTIDEALISAYNDIKHRKGQMRCGIFVKQASIDLLSAHNLKLEDFTTAESLEDTLENLSK